MIKTLVIVDSFKNSINSREIGELFKNYLPKEKYDVEYFPVSDGGEGFLETLIYNNPSVKQDVISTLNANGTEYDSPIVINENVVYIESAHTCGFQGLDSIYNLNPWNYSSTGLGRLLKKLIDKGFKDFVIGLGGTCINDAGIGLLSELGFKFLSKNQIIENPMPKEFLSIDTIIPFSTDYSNIKVTLASDVNNELLGDKGATKIFGKQKGLTLHDLELMEKSIKHMVDLFSNEFQYRKGTGAAGGLAYGLYTGGFEIQLNSGAYEVINSLDLKEKIKNSDLIISGEGSIDQQTKDGKFISHITHLCSLLNKDLRLICGYSYLDSYDGFKINPLVII